MAGKARWGELTDWPAATLKAGQRGGCLMTRPSRLARSWLMAMATAVAAVCEHVVFGSPPPVLCDAAEASPGRPRNCFQHLLLLLLLPPLSANKAAEEPKGMGVGWDGRLCRPCTRVCVQLLLCQACLRRNSSIKHGQVWRAAGDRPMRNRRVYHFHISYQLL